MPSYEFQNPIGTKFRMSDFWTMQGLNIWGKSDVDYCVFLSIEVSWKEHLEEAPLETAF